MQSVLVGAAPFEILQISKHLRRNFGRVHTKLLTVVVVFVSKHFRGRQETVEHSLANTHKNTYEYIMHVWYIYES